MQNGEYIVNRVLPKMVRTACDRSGIDCQTFSDDWVLRLSKGSATFWIFGYKFSLNDSASAHIAQDKVATYEALTGASVPAVPHELARTVTGESQLKHIANDTAIVMKPLQGTGGHGIELHPSLQSAVAALRTKSEPSWAFSPLLDIVSEVRIIVLDGEPLLAYRKLNPIMLDGLRVFNLGFGAVAENIEIQSINQEFLDLTKHATAAINIRVAAVDIAVLSDGRRLVLEVNDGITMEHYAAQSPEYYLQAQDVYDTLIERLFSK